MCKRKNDPGNSGPQDFLKFAILRYVCAFCEGFWCIFCHFPSFFQKYPCVPKIGFSADISIDVLTDVSIDISIDVSTDEGEEGRKEGRKEWTSLKI